MDEIRKLTTLPTRLWSTRIITCTTWMATTCSRQAGATIVAHPGVRAWMRTENIKMLDPPVTPEKKARVQSLTLPTVVYDGHIDLYLGSRRIDVRYFPGHTGGDSVVWIPDAHVVFCGDMLWKKHVPNPIEATWVPGHGHVANAEDVVTLQKYLADLRAAVRREQAAGKSGDAVENGAGLSTGTKIN